MLKPYVLNLTKISIGLLSCAIQILSTADHEKIRTSVTKFHHLFPQNSIIARIEAADQSIEHKELIIVSAHEVHPQLIDRAVHNTYI